MAIPRATPLVDGLSGSFWTAGRDGVLAILQCADCTHRIHPPAPRCRHCRSSRVSPQPVSGRGHVYSFTVNHHRWNDEVDEPYVVAIVELDDEPGLRLTTNIVGCAPDEVAIGMAVVVEFVAQEQAWIPVFRPAET